MLGAIVAVGFGSLLMSNPRRKKRRKSIARRRRNPTYGYVAFWRGKRTEVYANTSLEARDLAAKKFGAKKAYEVNVVLAEKDGKPVIHTPTNPRRRNPETEVHELVLFITNDGGLYRQQAQPIIKNLRKKIAKGTYDATKALKLWGYLANSGAQKYTKEYGSPGPNGSYGAFNAADRRAAAKELAESYEEELHSTNPRRSRKWRSGGTRMPSLLREWKKRWGHGRRVDATGHRESTASSRRRARRKSR